MALEREAVAAQQHQLAEQLAVIEASARQQESLSQELEQARTALARNVNRLQLSNSSGKQAKPAN